jgi:hypothetical protein
MRYEFWKNTLKASGSCLYMTSLEAFMPFFGYKFSLFLFLCLNRFSVSSVFDAGG